MENKSQNVKDSGTVDRQNVSFKFTKKVSKAASGNKLEEKNLKADSQKDFVFYVNESKIKSSISREEKEKELVIPLIKQNKWRATETADSVDPESKLRNLAVEELLKESKEKNEQWDKRDLTEIDLKIPLMLQNKVPEGFETDEKMDVSLRPEESKLEDYERVPVEHFGLAVLRGMGWKQGQPIGANTTKAAEPIQVQLRPKGLGLGADASALNKSKDNKKTDEKLELNKGAYVRIVQGKCEGSYGQVLGLDEENGRVIVKISGGDKTITCPEFSIEVISKKVFDKESKVINREKYEKYVKERVKEISEDKSKRSSHRDGESSKKEHKSSEKKRSYDSSSDSAHDQREKDSKKGKSHKTSQEQSKRVKTWVKPLLKVRLIDDKYKKGKYFNEKVVVMDMNYDKSCSVRTQDGHLLDDVSQSMLETVIPKSDESHVMIVQGKYAGELCAILERNKSKYLATVQLLSDRERVLELSYDSICEWTGDISMYD